MIGAIIGDVVGSRFEFHNIKSKKFLMFHPFCHVTDDTVMTIAIAKSLYECFSLQDVKLEDLCVKNMQLFGRKVPTTYGKMFYKWIWSDNPKPYNSYGNGAVMRISPVAYFSHSLKECCEIARTVTAVTHNHPQALKGAECVACCIYLSIHDYGKEYIRNFVNENYYKLNFTLDEIRESYTYKGDCEGTVPYAIECFLEGKDFKDMIRNAISIGGDSDTIAAIAGSIAEPMMPYKYYKIAKYYCRKNLFLWKQFKYIEYARIFVMETYRKETNEYKKMWLPIMKKRKYDYLNNFVWRFSNALYFFNEWFCRVEIEKKERTGRCNLPNNYFVPYKIVIEIGESLLPLVEKDSDRLLLKKIEILKKEYYKENNLKIPRINITDGCSNPCEFKILIYKCEGIIKKEINNVNDLDSASDEIINTLKTVLSKKKICFEMQLLEQELSGLPVHIFVYDSKLREKKYGKNIIKFQNDMQIFPNTTNLIPMSIEDNPKILLSDDEIKRKVKLDSNQIDELKRFVIKHKDVLNALENSEVEMGDFLINLILSRFTSNKCILNSKQEEHL